jgi:hypothetical protein
MNNLMKSTDAVLLSAFRLLFFISVDVRSRVNVVNLPFTPKSVQECSSFPMLQKTIHSQ